MKFLCVTNDVGTSAAGVVFETIIRELSKEHDIYVISPNISETSLKDISAKTFKSIKVPKIYWRIEGLSTKLLGCNIFEYISATRQVKSIDVSSYGFDYVISFVSQQKYYGLIVGHYLRKILNIKWIVYSVDAIPLPKEWDSNRFRRNVVRRFFNRIVKECDLFLSANPQMLSYQENLFEKFKGRTDVLYTPMTATHVDLNSKYDDNQNADPIFLFSGNIYGLRKIEGLIKGFRRLLIDMPNVKLIVVGNNSPKIFEPYKDLITNNNLVIYPFMQDLSNLYQMSTVLLDINADIPNDVFLSSKIANYLKIYKPIICISGEHSPARQIFINDESIIHCKQNVESIYAAMKKSLSIKEIPSSRESYIQLFSASHVCEHLISTISYL